MNQVVLTGRIVGQPVVKEFSNGRIVMFSIAVNERFKDKKSGQEKEVAHFFDVEAVGSAASMSLSKGDLITVEGSLRQDRWETPSGEKRSKVKIVAFKLSKLASQSEKQVVEQKTVPQKQPLQKQSQTKAAYKTYNKKAA
jgi:single-strand DNA-binding protein